MTTLVTGASGFLGSHVAEQLSKRGQKVRALVRKSSNTKFLQSLANVELAYGSVEDKASVLAASEGITGIVHAAGLVKARGPAEFRVQEREDLRFLPDGRFSIKDADGNVYELASLDKLDDHSRRAVEPLL